MNIDCPIDSGTKPEDQQEEAQKKEEPPTEKQPGYCSATCTDKACLQKAIKKPIPKTSDLFLTCNLPKRFEHPHWFNGYGCQLSKQHPFYRTTSSEYGWYPPDYLRIASEASTRPRRQFVRPARPPHPSVRLSSSMDSKFYCIHSVPSVYFPAGQKFTNHLASAGMYRNYSLNTGMDPASYL